MSTMTSEIQAARKRISREAIDMTVGELASLYENDELIISPPYQRLFRWQSQQKTRFVESIFLNVPIPAIFIYTRPDGKWELVDGLQRVSTCFEFMGKLKDSDDRSKCVPPLICDGTNLVPSLGDGRWPLEADKPDDPGILPPELQLNFKRARLRMEVLGPDTDADVRFELFQRLNSGGSKLSEQEVRNCIIYSINPTASGVLAKLAENEDFKNLTQLSERQVEEQYDVELVVRLVALRHVSYNGKADVHEYLNSSIIIICKNAAFDWDAEANVFANTFRTLRNLIGDAVFRKGRHWSLGLFEILSLATSKLVETENSINERQFKTRYTKLLSDPALDRYTGAGVRGTDRWRGFVTAYGYDLFTK